MAIANPVLMAIKFQTPEQMALVNVLYWVGELGAQSCRRLLKRLDSPSL